MGEGLLMENDCGGDSTKISKEGRGGIAHNTRECEMSGREREKGNGF